jgi:glycerophosphoryl diester phosphodiesterase
LGQLNDPELPFMLRKGLMLWRVKRQAVHPYHTMVNQKFVASAHSKGRRVNAWTVNEPDEMRRLIGLGVDGIITDRPDVLHGILNEMS